MTQDPWAEFRVGAPSGRQDAVIAPPNPYKQAAEQRAQEDQAREAERMRLAQEAAMRASEDQSLQRQQFELTRQKTERELAKSPATESERTAAFLATRLASSSQQLAAAIKADKSAQSPSFGVEAVRSVLGDTAANYLTDEQRQQVEAAQLDIIDAALTLGTGAAYTAEQLEAYRRSYFPKLGDSEAAIRDKQQRLRALLESARVKAGASAPDIDRAIAAIMPPSEGQDPLGYDDQGDPVPSTYQGALYDRDGNYLGFAGGTTDDTPPSGGGGGFLDTLGTATQNTIAGAVQGIGGLYDLGAQAGDAIEYGLRQGGGAALDAFGAEGAADWWRGNQQPTATVYDAVEKISPTPEGYENARFASQIVGGMMVPFGPKAATRITAPNAAAVTPNAAREVVNAGKQAGVTVMTSDVRPPTTFTGKMARATGERIPYAGTGGARAAQQEERVQAVKDLARDFGADVADGYLDDIAADLAKTRGGQLTALTKAKDAVIDGVQGAFVAPRTVQAIDEQIARLRGIDEGSFSPVIQRLEAFKANIQSGKSLREVEGNRKLLGDLFADPNLASIRGDGQKAINSIYGPLRDDMAAFIKQNAGNDAYNKWAAANKRLSALAGELDSTAFKNVLRNADTTPEQVSRLLFNKQPSEVRRLYQNLSPEGKAKARAGLIHLAVEKAGGLENISPDKFVNALTQSSKAAGVVFEGADLARLQGLERLLKATRQAGVASAAPPTGVQNSQMVGGVASYAAFGPQSLAVLGGAGALARLYESPLTRNLLIGLSKTTPGSPAESQWIERILKAGASQTERMGNAANDIVSNSPGRAAAQDE